MGEVRVRLRKSNLIIFYIALRSKESLLVTVEMVKFILKLLLKQNCAVNHDFH